MNKTAVYLGKRLKELRTKRGLSQEKLAELVGVSPKAISHYETARTFPSKHLIEIAEALDVTISELLDNDYVLSDEELKQNITETLDKLSHENLIKCYKLVRILYC